MEFFTEDDIQLLNEYHEQEYRETRKAAAAQNSLSVGVWAKTKHWAQLASGADFEVDCRISVLRQAGTKKAQAGSKQTMLRKFRGYTWARLLRPSEAHYQVFFTVGVDGERQELVWKLDCKRNGSNALNERQVARFDAYQQAEASATAWKAVPLKQLTRWNWAKLVAATQEFMAENSEVYEEVIRQTWAGHEPGRDKLARVCWNSYGWQRPSGVAGKSTNKDLHESDSKFGGEEWLFDFARLLDGYHYAYLRPIQVGLAKHAGATYNIRLYARNEQTGECYYVGRLHNAQVLTEDEIDYTTKEYRSRGWLGEMDDELGDVGVDSNMGTDTTAWGPFNIRFRPGDVERPVTTDGLELIEQIGEWTETYRYVLLEDVRAQSRLPKLIGKKDDPLDMRDKAGTKYNGPGKRHIRPGVVELPSLHNQVQDHLVKYLETKFPKHRVVREVRIREHGTSIDVVRERPDKRRTFYEVKVLPTLRACILEALGQLLEYAHWPSESLATELVIVSHHESDPEVAAYLTKLGEAYGLHLGYLRIGIGGEAEKRKR